MGVDVDEFVERGFVHLPRAVPAGVVAEVRARAEHLVPGPFGWGLGQATVYDLPCLVDALSPPVRAGIDALVGAGRWFVDAVWGFPTRFPGPIEPAWHIDGDWFTHHLGSSEQVLTPIFLWDDVDEGATLLVPGSHRRVAQLLAEHEPDGIPGDRIIAAVGEVVEGTGAVPAAGRAGDVYLCHPHLAHSINPVGPPRRRVISNVCVHHWGPLPFRAGELNAVERAIAQTVTPTTEPMT